MPIVFVCSCGKRLQVGEASAGKKVRCPVCGQVSTAPAQIAPEDAEPLQVLPVVRPAPSEEFAPQRRSPVRPPPLPPAASLPRPEAGGATVIEVVDLTLAASKGKGEPWQLEMGQDEVRLIDATGGIAVRFDRSDANNRFSFPSFWFSIKHLQVADEKDHKFPFYPDKSAVIQIRTYLERALREDPEARRKLRQRGLWVILTGLISCLLGAGGLTFLVVIAGRGQRPEFVGSIVGIVIGLALVGSGIRMCRKAARMDRQQGSES
jgi:hypothetical protein